MGSTSQRLRGLVLSATELRMLNPQWSDAMIEDYLNFWDNLVQLADVVDTKVDTLLTVKIITLADSPYTPDVENEIFADTDGGAISISIPQGTDGKHYRISNVGSAGNAITLVPYLTEKLFGVSDNEFVYDGEVLDMTYKSPEGWN
ncbi:MAG: hypothetical protein ACD_62C00371G0001 [uncultured bacterium]|nr:MAG: hypothetical protein ACD_62C00371G0001 [uncultured bacterium]